MESRKKPQKGAKSSARDLKFSVVWCNLAVGKG